MIVLARSTNVPLTILDYELHLVWQPRGRWAVYLYKDESHAEAKHTYALFWASDGANAIHADLYIRSRWINQHLWGQKVIFSNTRRPLNYAFSREGGGTLNIDPLEDDILPRRRNPKLLEIRALKPWNILMRADADAPVLVQPNQLPRNPPLEYHKLHMAGMMSRGNLPNNIIASDFATGGETLVWWSHVSRRLKFASGFIEREANWRLTPQDIPYIFENHFIWNLSTDGRYLLFMEWQNEQTLTSELYVTLRYIYEDSIDIRTFIPLPLRLDIENVFVSLQDVRIEPAGVEDFWVLASLRDANGKLLPQMYVWCVRLSALRSGFVVRATSENGIVRAQSMRGDAFTGVGVTINLEPLDHPTQDHDLYEYTIFHLKYMIAPRGSLRIAMTYGLTDSHTYHLHPNYNHLRLSCYETRIPVDVVIIKYRREITTGNVYFAYAFSDGGLQYVEYNRPVTWTPTPATHDEVWAEIQGFDSPFLLYFLAPDNTLTTWHV